MIRGNASEIIALAGGASSAKGVDSRDAVETAQEAARQLARHQGCVVAVSPWARAVTGQNLIVDGGLVFG